MPMTEEHFRKLEISRERDYWASQLAYTLFDALKETRDALESLLDGAGGDEMYREGWRVLGR